MSIETVVRYFVKHVEVMIRLRSQSDTNIAQPLLTLCCMHIGSAIGTLLLLLNQSYYYSLLRQHVEVTLCLYSQGDTNGAWKLITFNR